MGHTDRSRDPFLSEGAAPPDLIDDLPTRQVSDDMADRAYDAFVVAMQRTGTTRAALREALEAALNG